MARTSPLPLLALVTGLLLRWATPVGAHVTLEIKQAAAHSEFKAVFRVPHGCAASPTVRLRVRIPEGVSAVVPQAKAGWKLELVRTPASSAGARGAQTAQGAISDRANRVTEVTWFDGRLPVEQVDQFVIAMRLPDRPGETLYFPLVQECVEGVHRWIEVPADGKSAAELREPAPALRLTPGQ